MLVALGAAIVLGAVLITTGLVVERRERTVAAAGDELRRLSVALSEQTTQRFHGIDVVLRAGAEAYQAMAAAGASPSAVATMLRERAAAFPDIVRLHAILGADGIVQHASRPDASGSPVFAEREFFIAHREYRSSHLHVSGAFRLPGQESWNLALTRRLESLDGAFAGVALALVDAAIFERIFQGLDLGPGMAVALLYRDGTLIARFPPAAERVGETYAIASPLAALGVQSSDRVFRQAPRGDSQAAHLLALRALPEIPLIVALTADESVVLADWRREAWTIIASVIAALAVVLFLIASLARQFRRHEAVASELAESRRWLERAQAAAQIGSWVTRLSGRDDWSPETYRLFGVDPATFSPSVESFETLVHPDDRGRVREAARQSIRTGIAYSLVHRIVRPDGTVRWVHAQADVIRNEQGRTVQMIGTMQDVTERKIAEDALRLSEARLRDYVETASDWYWETGPDDRFTYMSSRIKVFGFDNGIRIGKTRREIAADVDEEPEKWRDIDATIARREPFRDFVYKMQVGGERESYCSVSGKPVFEANGQFAGYRGTARDVTAMMQAEEKLREAKTAAESASAAKTSFLANMSHELRTPLNAIIGFAEALAAGYFGKLNNKQGEYVRDIKESGNHLLLLINDLLDVAKIEAGKFELQPEPIHLGEEVQSCLRLVASRAAEGGVVLETKLPETLPLYRADRRALKQVVLNLLSNAVKFTLPGGRVTVSIDHDDVDGVNISVADTGIGIAPQDLPKVVLPFGSLARNANLSRRREGTGLGLPLSKSLIEMHGGRLEILSEIGRGTIATVRLPPAPVIPRSPSTAAPR